MHFVKRSSKTSPTASLVLLDWSVRESFHLLHYLKNQNVGPDSFEVILIEYYSNVSEAAKKYSDQIDTWVCLEVPDDCYYHKHLMYNAGIMLSRGEIVVFCDSDSMVKEGFVKFINDSFKTDSNIVLHLDQFRNTRQDFYPFNFPSFDDVAGEGCINNANGRTAGLTCDVDTIHTRNYGACMCARREDLIAIGGADEHTDYLGHICGPYEMTFRLVNKGCKEIWSDTEFLYHTWHPGQAGEGNYLGPHDGRHISTRAIEALLSGRVDPHIENRAIKKALKNGKELKTESLEDELLDKNRLSLWRNVETNKTRMPNQSVISDGYVTRFMGFEIVKKSQGLEARPMLTNDWLREEIVVNGDSMSQVIAQIDAMVPAVIGLTVKAATLSRWAISLAIETTRHFIKAMKRKMAHLPPGGSGVGAPGKIQNISFAAKLKTLSRQIRDGLDFNAESMYGLMVNLSLIKTAKSDPFQAGRPKVITGDILTKYLLAALGLMAIVPKVDIEMIKDDAMSDGLLENLGENGGALIICRDIFIKHHEIMARSNVLKKAQII